MFSRGILREYSSALSFVARVFDVFCILLGAALAYAWRFDHWPMPMQYRVAIILGVLLTLILFSTSGIYQSWRGKSVLHQTKILTLAWIGVIIALILVAFLTKSSALLSRQWLVAWVLFSWALLLLFRMSLTYVLHRMRKSGFNRKRIVIYGAGVLGRNVAKSLQNADWTGLDIVGFFDDNTELNGSKVEGIKVHGSVEKLSQLAERSHIDEIWLALPLRAENRVKDILYNLRHFTATIRFVPDIFGLRLINHSVAEVAGFPVINLSESPMYGLNRLVKFMEDKFIAGIILILVSPLMLILAIGVKLSSPGPVFYRQERVSWNGKPFYMLKFRSMPVDCESKTGAVWAKPGEARATKFGAFLRKTSLDELPQFIDVLKGNMSIVGPRPERPVFVEKFKDEIPDYMKKHMVKAGITGWAQVNGWRGNTDIKKRIEYDLYYIEHWSLWFDVKIILRTLVTGFVNKNAY